jgi:hypothetical protein
LSRQGVDGKTLKVGARSSSADIGRNPIDNRMIVVYMERPSDGGTGAAEQAVVD